MEKIDEENFKKNIYDLLENISNKIDNINLWDSSEEILRLEAQTEKMCNKIVSAHERLAQLEEKMAENLTRINNMMNEFKGTISLARASLVDRKEHDLDLIDKFAETVKTKLSKMKLKFDIK